MSSKESLRIKAQSCAHYKKCRLVQRCKLMSSVESCRVNAQSYVIL